MSRNPARWLWKALTSLELTIVSLSLLMVLVFACTLAQVELGTLGAVDRFIRAPVVWWGPEGSTRVFPVFPGGATVGFLLALNLIAAQAKRLQWTAKKAGIWIVHAGLILLVVGEFIASTMQVESNLTFREGETLGYVERTRELELAVTDVTDPGADEIWAFPAKLVARKPLLELPGKPVTLQVKAYYKNAELYRRQADDVPLVTRGVGMEITVEPKPPTVKDNERDISVAVVEPLAGGKSLGTWLVSNGLGAPQSFVHEGRTYELSMRSQREYLGYSLTLKEFTHDRYPGTEIPKNFASLVQLENAAAGESREVQISMNQPLRYGGKAFYQASFGENDTLSVLQVVENPGWLLPYISCALVSLGLIIHFAIALRRSGRRRAAAASPDAAPTAVEAA